MSDMAINGSSSPRLATSAFGRNPDIRQLVSFRPGSPQIRGTALWVLRGIGRGRFAPPAPVQREMRQGKDPAYMAGPVVSHAFGLSVGSLRIREGVSLYDQPTCCAPVYAARAHGQTMAAKGLIYLTRPVVGVGGGYSDSARQ